MFALRSSSWSNRLTVSAATTLRNLLRSSSSSSHIVTSTSPISILPATRPVVKPPPVAAESTIKTGDEESLLHLLRQQPSYYAICDIHKQPYLVTKNDLVFLSRCPKLQLGDVLELNQIREFGSKNYALQGRPYINPNLVRIRATVIEHPLSKKVFFEDLRK